MIQTLIIALAVVLTTLFVDPAAARRGQNGPALDVIETQLVSTRGDRTTIKLGRKEGAFDAIAVRILDRPIKIRSIEIVFGNGKTQDVKVGAWLDEEQETEVIDLVGNTRFIRRVVVNHRPLPRRRTARIQILGHAAGPDFEVIQSVRVPRGESRVTLPIGRDAGRLRSIAIRALDRPINIRAVEVLFGNGDRGEYRVRKWLDDNETSDEITFNGADRFIRRVEVIVRPVRGRSIGTLQVLAERGSGRGRGYVEKQQPDQWVLLGTKKASLFRKDSDTFPVGRGAGRFKAIRVTAKKHDVKMYGMRIVYGNGSVESVPIYGTLEDGRSSPPFDLKGRDRFIDHISFKYRTKLNLKGSGRVELWGLRAR